MTASDKYVQSVSVDDETYGSTGEGRLTQDARDMRRLGNKQALKRNFHSLAVLGLTSLLVQTWAGILVNMTYSLINGGRAGSVWAFFGTWVFQFPMIASLAEMASMALTAGGMYPMYPALKLPLTETNTGQYHWISEFAPKSCQRPISYVSGWLAALGWQTIIGATAYSAAVTITTMVSISIPSYTPQLWQITLLTIAIGVFAIIFNIFAAKLLPQFEAVVLCCYIIGFFVVVIPLWVLAPKAPASEVFTSFENYGGWASLGSACVIGQTAAAAAFIGVDSAAHISEEVKNASIAVPRMMMATLLLNGALGFVMVITYAFVIQDIETQILNSDSPFPWIGVFATATNSTAWALGMAVPLVVINVSACINAVMAGSRQVWSFARDDGLPYASVFTKIVEIDSTPVPINSMLASLIVLVILALLNLGGSTIINSVIGLLGGAIGTTYILSIGCVLWRRLYGKPLPPAKWSLGRFGVPINAVAVGYQCMATIVGFFPLFSKVDAQKMNWSIVVFGGVAIICAINYIVVGRKKYKGPVVRVMKDT